MFSASKITFFRVNSQENILEFTTTTEEPGTTESPTTTPEATTSTTPAATTSTTTTAGPKEWIQMGSDINGSFANDNLGSSTAVSDDGLTFIVGSPKNDQNGTDSGCSTIYSWNGSEWIQKGQTIYGASPGDQQGWSVSIDSSGNTIVIGSPYGDIGGSNSGTTRVYEWQGSSWIQKGSNIIGEFTGDQGGFSVDISDDGNAISIGAAYNDATGTSSGNVRIYYWNGSSWMQRGSDIAGETAGDLSGYSVSGDGNTIAIGSILNDGNGSNSGSVRVYDWNGSSWAKRGSDIDGESAGDQSGFSVSMSRDGNILAIGAPFNDGKGSNSGQVRVYSWNGSSWVKKGQDIDGEAPEDASGYDVSMNGDGSVVAIGAIYNDGGGTNSGHVRIYSWNGSSWAQTGSDIDGKNPGDQSGSGKSVSLNLQGDIVVIGAPYNDANGTNSGHVRVFRFTN